MNMQQLYLLVPLAPLAGAIVVGLWGPKLGRAASHWICILGVAVSMAGSALILRDVMAGNGFTGDVYIWMTSGDLRCAIGVLIDALTALMITVMRVVSLMLPTCRVGSRADT